MPKKPKTLPNHTGPILRGNTPFISIKEIGELGDNGKAVMKIGYGDRIIAKPELPLTSLAVPIIEQLLPVCHYRNRKEANKDLSLLREYVMRLGYSTPTKKKSK